MTTARTRQPKGLPVGGQFAATSHDEPQVTLADPPAGRRTSKGVVTTVTLPDGVVATRTSEKGNYTHAVVLPPEDPELVRKVRGARIAEIEERIALIDRTLAAEKPAVKIRSRGLHGRGKDPDVGYDGQPSYTGFEIMLIAADGRTVLETSYSNSKGTVKGATDPETGKYDSEAILPARKYLAGRALSSREQLVAEAAGHRQALEGLDAGTYDLGRPEVARWSSREDLAAKAAGGEFAKYHPTRRAYVVPVDGYGK